MIIKKLSWEAVIIIFVNKPIILCILIIGIKYKDTVTPNNSNLLFLSKLSVEVSLVMIMK